MDLSPQYWEQEVPTKVSWMQMDSFVKERGEIKSEEKEDDGWEGEKDQKEGNGEVEE